MAASSSTESYEDMFAEEMVKIVLLKDFGIYWEPDSKQANSKKLALEDYYSSCALLAEAVTNAWKKFYAAVEQESQIIHKSLEPSATAEKISASLKAVAKKINLPKEYIIFIVIAVFGELCVCISKSGAQHLISIAVAGAKKYIVEEGLANKQSLQMNSVQFMDFLNGEKNDDKA